jgi:aspartyl-tRNA(Asn)/glutamyl-tRNA(Gln) amidotransferase subunit A
VAVKDNADVAGWPTRAGTAASDPAPAPRDAALVADLRRAGAVILGKVATHEITYGVTTRAVANPKDPHRLAGGSSGGSAVAVATGAVPLAVGSDTAGSVRIPAALCGVAGLMGPRLSVDGFRPLAPGLDTAGLLARDAGDLAVAWRALTAEREPPAPHRVGIPPAAALGPIDEDVAGTVAAARAALAGAGVEPIEVEVPDFGEFARARATVIAADALAVQRSAGAWPDRAASFGEAVRGELERAERIDAETLDAARRRHCELGARLRAALDAVDVMAWPTTPCVAPPADDGDPPARADRRLAGVLTRLCGPVNAAGLAAVSVPCGAGAHGLPVGLHLVARSEATALGAALAYGAA